ncbi:type II toxin-antitoxin system VapC family toxin [Chthonobacter albigriseus]|uniref:type II toxin-antitoxin system VapC family toxin n=1 Tax=Chthonobacter albigriseus TaxID=1683161 RepID=UPI0015EFB823|nr:type II toxin-antitoxin system VapC family toxin [Chthonobacter albigriseus]
MRVVADCSIVVASALGETISDLVGVFERLLRRPELEILVPSIWPSEVANALLMAERKGRISNTSRQDSLARCFQCLPTIEPPPTEADLHRITALAVRHRLTIYDALYVDLAVRTNSVLASLDDAMLRAARTEGVAVLGDP